LPEPIFYYADRVSIGKSKMLFNNWRIIRSMRILIFTTTALLLAICGYSIYELKSKPIEPGQNVLTWYEPAINRLKSKVDHLCMTLATHQPTTDIQKAFYESRIAYKEIEVFAEYFDPYTVQQINGRANDSISNYNRKAFQVLEHLIYPLMQAADTQQAYIEARKLAAAVNRLHMDESRPRPTDAQLFDAMRLELVRIISLGISRFDSPDAGYCLAESSAALTGVKSIWALYADKVSIYNPSLVKYTNDLISAADKYLKKAQFDSFDRQAFITNYMNHLSVNLKLSREALGIPYDNEAYILDPAASNIFARNAVHPLYYSSDAMKDSAGSNDPLYDIDGQQLRASYMYTLLQQNGALNTVAEKRR